MSFVEVMAEFFHDMAMGYQATLKKRRERLAPRLPDGVLRGSLRLMGGSYVANLESELRAVTRPCVRLWK